MGAFWKAIKKILMRTPARSKVQQNAPANQKNLLTSDLKYNLREIVNALGNSSDIVTKEIPVGSDGNIKAGIVFTEGLADTENILESLMLKIRDADLGRVTASSGQPITLLKNFVLAVGDVTEATDFDSLFTAILSGDTAILIDGQAQGLIASKRKWKDRGVTEPSAQTVVRGPREGFSESLRTNTALIRRRIKDPNLWLETNPIGRITRTDVAIMYLKGIVNEEVLQEVRDRLGRIDIDGILESGYIEELIQDETFTPFPTIFNTERPDAVAAGILEGRVAILVDGTPFVLLVPALFMQFLQASEDYYQRWDFASLLRALRFVSFFISMLAPSLYIAITTFHQELLPPPLLIGLAAQREGVPFPAFVEAVMMELTFEILREAGVRMPRAIGQSVSIVGTLVIGQAAVEAGLVSPAMVIVVAITAISNFVFPSFNMGISIRIIRFGLMGIAASFGLFGITIGLVAIVLHLCSLRSFGVPYLAPFAPFIPDDHKDTIFRLPQWAMFSRPRLISQKNIVREQNNPTSKPE